MKSYKMICSCGKEIERSYSRKVGKCFSCKRERIRKATRERTKKIKEAKQLLTAE